ETVGQDDDQACCALAKHLRAHEFARAANHLAQREDRHSLEGAHGERLPSRDTRTRSPIRMAKRLGPRSGGACIFHASCGEGKGHGSLPHCLIPARLPASVCITSTAVARTTHREALPCCCTTVFFPSCCWPLPPAPPARPTCRRSPASSFNR